MVLARQHYKKMGFLQPVFQDVVTNMLNNSTHLKCAENPPPDSLSRSLERMLKTLQIKENCSNPDIRMRASIANEIIQDADVTERLKALCDGVENDALSSFLRVCFEWTISECLKH